MIRTFLFLLLLLPLTTIGQVLEGTVVYEQIVGVEFDFQRPGDQQQPNNPRVQAMLEQVPKEGVAQHTLRFNNRQTLYDVGETDFGETTDETEKLMRFMSRVRPPQEKMKHIFSDLEKNVKVEHFEFMTREFIVEEPLPSTQWKMVSERKKVLDYVCMGASQMEGDKSIIAWFSPEIPVSAGPGHYAGLPGLILAIETDGEITLMAKSVSLEPLELAISKPSDGTKVSREKFDTIKEEKVQEHRERLEQMRQMRQDRIGGPGRRTGKGND